MTALVLALLLDAARIESLTGAKGSMDDKEGVFKVSVPRADLAVVTGGVRMTPPMGLTSWAAFKSEGERTVVMGDLVLLEDQVKAVVDGDFAMLESELQGVLKALRGAGISVVAIHHHMTHEEPRILFLHYWGVGSTEALARGLRRALDETRRGEP
jgi:hypothetical protein